MEREIGKRKDTVWIIVFVSVGGKSWWVSWWWTTASSSKEVQGKHHLKKWNLLPLNKNGRHIQCCCSKWIPIYYSSPSGVLWVAEGRPDQAKIVTIASKGKTQLAIREQHGVQRKILSQCIQAPDTGTVLPLPLKCIWLLKSICCIGSMRVKVCFHWWIQLISCVQMYCHLYLSLKECK